MLNDNSAQLREETSHTVTSTNNSNTDALKRRSRLLIKDKSIDAGARAFIRYALEIDDPLLPELVRRADAGEPIIDGTVSETSEADYEFATEEKVEHLAEIICRPGDEPVDKSASLLVLMAMIENSTHPKVLANHAKHFAFTRCGELNCNGMIDTQVAALEDQLLTASTVMS